MTAKRGKVLIFSAPSGAGKTTIVRRLLKSHNNLAFSISATTRQQRAKETHGYDYFFLTKSEFEAKIRADEFLEWEEVYSGIYYGTLKSQVEALLDQGKHVLFDVDVKGGINIKMHYGAEARAFFICPPSLGILRKRLEHRATETREMIEKRLQKAEYEISFSDQFDHVIVNDELDRAVGEIEAIISEFTGA